MDIECNQDTSIEELGKSMRKEEVTKEIKAGVIYLSTVPPGLKIKEIRQYFGQFGEVGRSFFQVDDKGWKAKAKRKNQNFTEGWIEFKKRKHAKNAVSALNNNPVGGKKSKVYHDFLWNIKYLPGFQWVHLNERLAYERISKKQRMRAEISAVKREANFFAKSIELSKKLNKKKKIIEEDKDDLNENPETSVVDESSVQINKESNLQPSSNETQTEENTNISDRAEFFRFLFRRDES